MMVPLPSHLSLKLNSSLKPSLITLPYIILASFLLFLLPLFLPISCFQWNFSTVMYSMPQVPQLLEQYEVLCSHLASPNSSSSVCRHLPFLLSGSLPTFSLSDQDDRCNPSNYRPIDLISCLSKVFKSIQLFSLHIRLSPGCQLDSAINLFL